MDTSKFPVPTEDVTTFVAIMRNALCQDIVTECWRSIDGYTNYQVSNIGRVRNVSTGRILKPVVDTVGYYRVRLYEGGITKKIRIHRLVANEFLEASHEIKMVDHIDRNRLNNYVTNLRYVTVQQNQMNRTKRSNTSSKYKGVIFKKQCNKWQSRVQYDGKRISLGYFDNEQEAARAYNAKAMELFGEYANLNIVD
jgi:hypothetical protein